MGTTSLSEVIAMSTVTSRDFNSGSISDALRMSEDISFDAPRVDLELRVPEL